MLIVSNKYESLDRIMSDKLTYESTVGASKDVNAVKAAVSKIDGINKYLLDEQDPNSEKPDEVKFKFKSTNKDQYHLLQPLVGRISPDELKNILTSAGYTINGDVKNLKNGFTATKDGFTIGCRWTSTGDKGAKGGKAQTVINTELSERATLAAIMNQCIEDTQENRNIIKNDLQSHRAISDEDTPKINVYTNSAIKSARSFFNNINIDPKNYYGERQLETLSQPIYNKAKDLGAPGNKDNWNPADIWLFKKTFNIEKFLEKCKTLDDLNSGIEKEMKKFNIIPISLKQIGSNSDAEFDVINKDYVNGLGVDGAVIEDIHLGYTKGSSIFGSIEWHLKNKYTIHGHARASAVSDIMYYQLVPPGGGTNSGIDKAIVTKYVYGGSSILPEQRKYLNNKDENNIKEVNKIIAEIIKKGGKKLDTDKKTLSQMYVDAGEMEMPRFMMVLINLRDMLNTCDNMTEDGITVTQKLFLSGLKADASSGQCSHYKIH